MNLNCETILDFYKYNNKKFVCVIKVSAKGDKVKKNSLRFLSEDDWNNFDKELENLITTVDDWNIEKGLKFNITSNIQVGVCKSNISWKNFKCLGKIGNCKNDFDEEAAYIVLDCQFNFGQEVPLSFPKMYEPHAEASSDSISCSALLHATHTPKSKKYKTDQIVNVKTLVTHFVEYDDNVSTDDDKVSEPGIELESAINSRLDAVRKSINSSSCTQSDEIDSSGKDEHLRRKLNNKKYSPFEESIQEKGFHMRKHREQSKSDNVLLELNNVNIYENNLYQKEQVRTMENNGQYDIKTLDTTPDLFSSNVEILSSKSKLDDNIEKSCRSLEKSYKASSYRSEGEETKMCAVIEKSASENQTKSSLVDDEEVVEKKSNNSPKTPECDSRTDSTPDTSPQKLLRRERKQKSSVKDAMKILRRSERSPSKPKRFVDEQSKLLSKTKTKRHKISQKNKELFGTDDEDDDLFENVNKNNYNSNKKKASIFETPVSKKSETCTSSSSKLTKKKRKSDLNSECQQEKRHMSKWLSKKKISSEPVQTKSLKAKSKTKSSSYKGLPLKPSSKIQSSNRDDDLEYNSQSAALSPITLELPSKEELELIRNKTKLMQKENARVKAELDKMRSSPPKEVEILSLKNISVNDILDTFSTYKSDLDEIYENNHKRDYIKGHDGINHCFVIRLLEQNIQMKMLEKLTEVYNNLQSTTQATLFANALLPEWVIRVYMEKFNFNRQQAIDQVKAQEEFQLHMEEQNDNTFMFD